MSDWRNEIEEVLVELLCGCVTSDYADGIFENIHDDVVEDVMLCSGIADEDRFSVSDVKYSIGRVLSERLGVVL